MLRRTEVFSGAVRGSSILKLILGRLRDSRLNSLLHTSSAHISLAKKN